MDIGFVQTVLTVVFFIAFIGIVLWAWSGRRKQAFDEAARLPLEEHEASPGDAPQHAKENKDA